MTEKEGGRGKMSEEELEKERERLASIEFFRKAQADLKRHGDPRYGDCSREKVEEIFGKMNEFSDRIGDADRIIYALQNKYKVITPAEAEKISRFLADAKNLLGEFRLDKSII